MQITRRFQRRVEDFVCGYCNRPVTGDGFTNHCPDCFYSKHVDVSPGDRRAECGGLMEPIEVVMEGGGWRLTQRCLKCGFERSNRGQAEDQSEQLVHLAERIARRRAGQV